MVWLVRDVRGWVSSWVYEIHEGIINVIICKEEWEYQNTKQNKTKQNKTKQNKTKKNKTKKNKKKTKKLETKKNKKTREEY